jgi:hypothetical protein
VFAVALPEDALSRGWRMPVTAVSGGCCNGRSGAVRAAGRSLLAGSAGALLSISAEKPSGADGSVRVDLDGAFWMDRFAAVSDVTLNTGGLSR